MDVDGNGWVGRYIGSVEYVRLLLLHPLAAWGWLAGWLLAVRLLLSSPRIAADGEEIKEGSTST